MDILSTLQHKVRKELTLRKSILIGGLLFAMGFSSIANAINITVSIPPLAGMIKPLLSDEDRINVLLKPGASPHGFQLKPSNIRTLQDSDLVLWVGTAVDHWMKKPLQNITVPKSSMLSAPNIEQFKVRQGGLWEQANHHHDEHENGHEHESLHSSEMGQMDPHIWVSFHNAQSFIKSVSKQLQLLKPNQAQGIQQKTQAWLGQLAKVDLKIQSQLKPVENVPYMVLHDGFHYFSNRYHLNGIGSIQLNPAISPSLKRVAELRKKIKQGDVRCVFKEPQFPAKRVYAVTKNLKVKVGSLDPIGLVSKAYQHKNHANYLPYDVFVEQLANQFYDCLSETNK